MKWLFTKLHDPKHSMSMNEIILMDELNSIDCGPNNHKLNWMKLPNKNMEKTPQANL